MLSCYPPTSSAIACAGGEFDACGAHRFQTNLRMRLTRLRSSSFSKGLRARARPKKTERIKTTPSHTLNFISCRLAPAVPLPMCWLAVSARTRAGLFQFPNDLEKKSAHFGSILEVAIKNLAQDLGSCTLETRISNAINRGRQATFSCFRHTVLNEISFWTKTKIAVFSF
jgi:hypothetical protein